MPLASVFGWVEFDDSGLFDSAAAGREEGSESQEGQAGKESFFHVF